jgi:hypothetical protein
MSKEPLLWTIDESPDVWLSALANAPDPSVAWGNVIHSLATGYNAAWHADDGSVKRDNFFTLQEGIDWCNRQYEDMAP